jgi:GT2 family glycosyltransferase
VAEQPPTVGIVVVNWFGGDRTIGCLESLEKLTWPRDRLAVCLVDNGSDPGWPALVRERFPDLRLVESGRNLGFGGACNLGFEALSDCTYVALLNNDAIPDPGWLEPLVEVLEADPRCGAATPKVLLDGAFVLVELRSDAATPTGDSRPLGVQLCGARVAGRPSPESLQLVRGFWGWEVDATTVGGTFAWTDGNGVALLSLPTDEGGAGPGVELRLACGTGRRRVSVKVEGATDARTVDGEVSEHPEWIDVGPAPAPVSVINNTGTRQLPDGSVTDRGYFEPDQGQFEAADEVWGWSGAAVLIARRFLEDVGGFDTRYFLYYEDADLSWRGKIRGWSYRYVPESVVRHERSATVGTRSAMSQHLAARNRLLLLVKLAPFRMAWIGVIAVLRALLAALRKDVGSRVLRGRRPLTMHVGALLRVLGGFLQLAPAALGARRRVRRAAKSDPQIRVRTKRQ